jgi:hypothetical protein
MKPWFASKGVWGGIILMVLGVIEAVFFVLSGNLEQLPEAIATFGMGLAALGIRLRLQ